MSREGGFGSRWSWSFKVHTSKLYYPEFTALVSKRVARSEVNDWESDEGRRGDKRRLSWMSGKKRKFD